MNGSIKVVSEELLRIGKNSTQIIYDRYLVKLIENPEETKFVIETHVGDTKYRTFIDKNKNCVGVIYMFAHLMCGVIVFDNDIEKQIELAVYMNYIHIAYDRGIVPRNMSEPMSFLVMRRYTTGESIYSFVLQSELNKLNSVHRYFLTYDEAWSDFLKTLN